MKKIYLLICVILMTLSAYMQTADGFKYQAIIRKADGNINANTSVNLEISIIQGETNGPTVFIENHNVVTNDYGLVNIIIGSKDPISFNLIDWANGPYFIKISVDGVLYGTSQLLSVPYALHAKTAERLINPPLMGKGDDKEKFITNSEEIDPVFTAWDKSNGISILESQISNFGTYETAFSKNSAFNKNFGSVSGAVAEGNDSRIVNGQTAYEWGNHALAGYLTSISETDPVFGASIAKGITLSDTAYWNSKLDSFSETDPVFNNWDKSSGISITESQVSDFGSYEIAFTKNTAFNKNFGTEEGTIVQGNDSRILNGQTAFEWGNHALAGYLKIYSETDPVFGASIAKGITAADTAAWNYDSGAKELNDLTDGKTDATSVFLGSGAGINDDEENFNVAVGVDALKMNTSGNQNTASGNMALWGNTTGMSNTAIGIASLMSNTGGAENTAVGAGSLFFNTTGYFNTANGVWALHSNTTGWNNTAIGHNAGSLNETGSGNIFLGYQAGFNETGSNKLYIENSNSTTPLIYGDFAADLARINGTLEVSNTLKIEGGDPAAGKVLTSDENGLASWQIIPEAEEYIETDPLFAASISKGITAADTAAWNNDQGATELNDLTDAKLNGNSLFLGTYAGQYEVGTFNGNLAVGNYALMANTTGNGNTATGYSALRNTTTGSSNTANGRSALFSNTTGSSNIAIGDNTLYSNTSGGSNTAIGNGSLSKNTTGGGNNATGVSALFRNTTGSGNSATGFSALGSNLSGSYNTANGYNALYQNTTGEKNVGMGPFSNYYNQEGSYNTIIGYEAGRGTALHNKSRNVFLGYQAGYNETESNKLYIENSNSTTPLVYGDFATDLARINGSLEVSNTLKIEGGDPAAGKVLTSDENGLASWQVIPEAEEYVETDPVFGISIAKGISGTDTTYWNNKLDSYTETDPVFETSIAKGISGADTTYWNNKLDSYTETDPVFGASIAKGITAADTAAWNKEDGANNLNDLTDAKITGNSLFIGLNTGASDDGSDNRNAAIGIAAMFSNTAGERNTAMGGGALYYNTTGSQNVANGYQALYKNNVGERNTANGYQALFDNTTGYGNTATGNQALLKNTEGERNTANGTGTLFYNTTGNRNTANGYESLYKNTIGFCNTANGYQVLYSNISGNHNTANGYRALFGNLTGEFNTAYGFNAGFSSNGSGNIFLGYEAGYNETGSNKLYIENSNSATPLIYGDFATNLARINGRLEVTETLKIAGGSPGDGKVLTSDASGNASWQPAAYQAYELVMDGGHTLSNGSSTGYVFNPPAGKRFISNGVKLSPNYASGFEVRIEILDANGAFSASVNNMTGSTVTITLQAIQINY